MKVFSTIVLVAVALFNAACSGNLSRNRAEAVLRERFPASNSKTAWFQIWANGLCFNEPRDPCRADSMSAELRELEKLGLISVLYEGNSSRISITQKGHQYSDGSPIPTSFSRGNRHFEATSVDVWVATIEFGSVTGISEPDQSNRVTVEFTTMLKPTPFASFAPVSQPRRAVFRKYDDGWRLVSQ